MLFCCEFNVQWEPVKLCGTGVIKILNFFFAVYLTLLCTS